MNFEYLETARLRLRKLTDVDYEQLLITASDADIMQILGISEQEVQKEKQKAERGFGMYNKAMVMFQIMQKQSNQVIGLCGFHIWYIQHNRAELGYMLNDDNHKQKGYMTEVLPHVLSYGFNQIDLHRIEALVAPHNVPSLKLLNKHSFKQEGLLKQHYFKNGVYEDSAIFALLKDDYCKEINQ